jgi:hypothetical protein
MAQVSCWYTCYLRNVVLKTLFGLFVARWKIGLIKCPTGVFVSLSCREKMVGAVFGLFVARWRR